MTPDRLEQFDAHRPLLFSIAYRMLGTVADAEDMVQEAFLRWERAAGDEIASPKAYLSAVVTRLCVDQLRSARAKRETYVGPWLPEPLVTEGRADAGLGDSLSMAFLVLLESLSPTERAAFLLHEVFDYDYAEIARVLDKSEAACRQVVHRARERVADRRPRFDASREAQERLRRRFVETCASGDLDGFVTLLSDDITLWSDGGGKVPAAINPIHGPDRVARFLLGLVSKAPAGLETRFVEINAQPGMLVSLGGVLQNALILDVRGASIHGIYIVRNPDKLARIGA